MRRVIYLALVLAPVWVISAQAQSSLLCDTAQKKPLDNAKAERAAKRYDLALNDANSVGSQSIRGQYTVGLIKLDQSADQTDAAKSSQLRKDGMAMLETVAQKIDQALAGKDAALIACLKDQKVFSVMNTLAFYYLSQGNTSKAEMYLKNSDALATQNLLDVDSQRKTYGNLGTLYFSVGNYDASNSYLSRAVALGNANPALPKLQAAIRVIKAPH